MSSEPESIFIWDFDGTLGYREGMWSGALADLSRGLRPDLALGPEAFRPHLQSGFPWHDWEHVRKPQSPDEWWQAMSEVIHRAVAKVERLAAADYDAIVAGIRDEYLRADSWALFPDVLPFFSSLFASTKRHVILSNHVPELEEILRSLGIRDYFEAVFNSSLTGIEKPHAEAFAQVLRAYPDASGLIMIGDSYEADIAPAESAGIPAVLLRNSDPRARWSCRGMDELPPLLGEIAASRSLVLRSGYGGQAVNIGK
ncbi:HAD family hydrolase [Luteolibacter luteus]|uniref:HAD family hydrolase n=1 Tax=Luteolibacter luteus TaxID=2728835 RepID=A0A858RN65_9BACT|nr:HAD family hydrolase [Luteolibacter luteus]QJE98031.1 HAD family hydrolase [Luteolibacter luteus]